jgi:hypothetical protein
MDKVMVKGKEIPAEILLQGENGKIYSITIDADGNIKASETGTTQVK